MQHTAAQVKTYSESLLLNTREWQDSPLSNLYYQSFFNIYPYDYKDTFANEITEVQYETLCIENEYLKATIIPSLGARVFSLYDKIAKKHVFNMTNAILPSPIYLRGVYFPVGLEFNFPHGHTTHAAEYVPCEFTVHDGNHAIVMHVFNAVTRIHTDIYVSLRPDERVLRVQVRFKNLLPIRNGFMYWANPAVENTPELKFLCKAPMCHFFDKYDTYPYINGEDNRISKNRRFASDLFAIGATEDWFGFYAPEKRHGCIHISPLSEIKGQKFFTFGFDDHAGRLARHYGCGKYGYVEIQAGILETQFEYLHLEPYEEKIVNESWFPYNDVETVSYANDSFIVSETRTDLKFTPSRPMENLKVSLTCGGQTKTTFIENILPGEAAVLQVPQNFDPFSYDLSVIHNDTKYDGQIRPTQPATEKMIKSKQKWLDLKPVDNQSTLEVAWRQYKSRCFDKAQQLVESLLDTEHKTQAHQLLAEIYYCKDDFPNAQMHAESASFECNQLLQVLNTKSKHTHSIRIGNHDQYERMSDIDILVANDKTGEARHLLKKYLSNATKASACELYVMGYLEHEFIRGNTTFNEYLSSTKELPLEQTNPFTDTERYALELAIKLDNLDSSAQYLLGNYWANKDKHSAIEYWQAAIKANPKHYLAIRNLAFVKMRDRLNTQEYVDLYERALEIEPNCPMLISEYIIALRLAGQLTKALNYLNALPTETGLDYRIVKAKILILRDNYKFAEAIDLILNPGTSLQFWEGEHYTHRCYLECLMALGNRAIEQKDFDAALKHFNAMLDYPETLVHGKSYDENQSAAFYHLGLAYENMGDTNRATEYYRQAVNQPYPNIHHAVSYREHEYHAAKAAQKINDKLNFDMIVARLTDVYDENFIAIGTEFLPTWPLYQNHLAAARGFMLIGEYDKAEKSLQNIKDVYGICWPYDQAKAELNSLQKQK
jgi:tetratricopeptide (TPR) repeat protein